MLAKWYLYLAFFSQEACQIKAWSNKTLREIYWYLNIVDKSILVNPSSPTDIDFKSSVYTFC